MGDLRFICVHCEQSLVIDESGAGGASACPHCERAIQIPGTSVGQRLHPVSTEVQELRRALSATENEAARSKSLLTDSIQELRKTRQTLAYTTAQLETVSAAERTAREAIAAITGEFTSAEEAREELEMAHRSLSHSQREAELTSQERDHLARRLEAVQSELAAASIDIAALRGERKECLFKLSGMEQALAETSQRAVHVEEENLRLKRELEALGGKLSDTCQALFAEQAKCAELAADLTLKPELAQFVEIRNAGDRWRDSLQQLEETVAEAHRELASAQAECEALRKEKLAAELKLAATRDALDDHHLQEENEVLKALVDRLNGELKDLGHALRRGPSTDPSLAGSVSEIKRWLVSRAFVPET